MGSISLFLVTITTITLLENLAYCLDVNVTVNGTAAPQLMDMKENTCINVEHSNISVDVSEAFTFTGMAVAIKGIAPSHTMLESHVPRHLFEMKFTSEDGRALGCTNGVQRFNKYTVDIYCVMKVRVKQVVAFLNTSLTLCELYIGGACHKGWFGDRCQYKCWCATGKCGSDGTCLAGDHCDTRWFGPACQYQNLVQNDGGLVHVSSVLTDQDDSTCVKVHQNESLRVTRNEAFVFTWMRLVAMDIPLHSTRLFRVTARSDEIKNLPLECGNERQHTYRNAVHIYCDFQVEKVKEVEVIPLLSLSLCSWYISGGRNIGLRQQKTSQPSVLMKWPSNSGLDGDSSKWCNRTENEPYSWMCYWYVHTWGLFFTQPRMIHRIRIYSVPDFETLPKNKTKHVHYYFRISTYDWRGLQRQLFKGPDPNITTRPSNFTFRFYPKLLSRIAVWVSGQINLSYILFGELDAWGDCPEGYYGLHCTKCPRYCSHDCNVLDGQCNECSSSSIACSRQCPIACIDDCDPETGQCLEISPLGTPMAIFLTITILGITLALSIAVGLGLTFQIREAPQE